MIGQKINGYELLRKIGEGGMAEVYYAENSIHKGSAVKILKKSLCEVEGITERFRNEAEVMVKLVHPNIRQVYDYAEVAARPAIIMEYLEGGDLSTRMKRGERFSDAQVVKWWNQMVSALNYTHQKGVVHRDIKPSNIFIDTEGDVRLMDFGIAKVKESISSTQTGAAMGTLLYMSPEQVDDVKRVDYRSDVYSLAVTFVHLLTGNAPYDATTTSDYQIRKSIVEKPLDLTTLPASWRSFLEPYLAKERDHRPALVHFSEQAKKSDAGEETMFSVPQPASEPRQSAVPEPKPKVDPNPSPAPKVPTGSAKRRNWLIAVGAAVAVAVLAVVIVLAVVKKKQEVVPEEEIIENAVTDYDGNSYDAVQIGDQVWMAENLRTTHYSDGTSIPQGSSESGTTGYWYYPDGNSDNKRTYGLLYNWPAVMHGSSSSERNPSGVQGICPKGWHVPSDAEWTQLENYVGSQSRYRCGGDAENIAKALASTTGWYSVTGTCAVGNNPSTNNATGFSAVPVGHYYGSCGDFGYSAYFWSATHSGSSYSYYWELNNYYAGVIRNSDSRYNGFSVRCLRD